MANEENLIPYRFNKRSANEARENGSKGGKKSGEVRRKRKAMKEQMEMLLTLPVKNQEQYSFISNLGIDKKEIDNQMALIVAMYAKALKGDVQAFNAIREVTQDERTASQEDRVQIINDLPNEEDEEDDKS